MAMTQAQLLKKGRAAGGGNDGSSFMYNMGKSSGGSSVGSLNGGRPASSGGTYDYGSYARGQRDVDYKYSRDSASNAYARFISQQRGRRNLDDMTRTFGRAYPRLAASYGARGLHGAGTRSGVRRQGMGDFIGDYTRSFGRAQGDLTQELQQYDLQQGNLDAWRQNSLAALEEQKAREIAYTAQNLEYLRNMVGSL